MSDLLPNPILDVEREFDVAVVAAGGCGVDQIIGAKPGHRAADYMFDDIGIVAELKCLKKDQAKDPDFVRKATEKYIRVAKSDKTMPRVYGTVRVDSSKFSESSQRQLADLYLVPIRRAVKSANEQIEQTKRRLDRSQHLGLLLLVNDGNTALHPGNICWALSECLKDGEFPQINHVIFFTVNQPIETPTSAPHAASGADCHVWFTFGRSGFQSIDSSFEPMLRKAWFDRLAAIHGRHVEFDGGSTDIYELRNKKV